VGVTRQQKLQEYVKSVSSPTPAPGGGSVAAVCGALGAALAGMVANIALGKKDYKSVHKELRKISAEGEVLQRRLLELAEQDTRAYRGVMKALQKPKATPSQKERRREAIQLALKKASEVPVETMEKCVAVLELSKKALEKGSKEAFTDAGSAALVAHAALEAAGLNVKVNLLSIKDEAFCKKIRAKMESLLKKGSAVNDKVSRIVDSRF
jgi:formiminotetrahydrofolate cyclodeaminase